MSLRSAWLAAALAALAAVVWTPAAAQTGRLEVVVADADGTPLPGATVELSHPLAYVARTAEVTGPDGRVVFPVLRAGPGYVLACSLAGHATRRRTDVRVAPGETVRIEVRLLTELNERVEVQARDDVVDLDRVGGSNRFSDEFLDELPVLGRFYQNALTLAPGIKDADEDGNPNVHGARSRDFQASVSGISNVDPLTGQWLSYVNPDSIEELETLTWGAGAEFGRAQGGFARIVQKQGSNDFEGSFNLLWRSSLLDGGGAAHEIGRVTPEFESWEPGLQLSGPIVRDRLWYRFSHERIDRQDPVDTIGIVGVKTREQWVHADQITWQASPRNKLAFQYQADPVRLANFDLDAGIALESNRLIERGGPTYSVTWTAPQSSRLIVETLLAYQDHTELVGPAHPDSEQECLQFYYYRALNSARCYNSSTGITSGPYPETSDDRRQRLTFRTDATIYVDRFLGTSHQLKIGGIVENERYFRALTRGPDMLADIIPGLFGPDIVHATVNIHAPRESRGRATGTSWALYAEDQIRPAPGLSVRLGLRIDREEIRSKGHSPFDPAAEAVQFFDQYQDNYPPAFITRLARETFTGFENIGELQILLADALGVPVSYVDVSPISSESALWIHQRRDDDVNITNNNLSPRFGIAWDPFRDGKTKISATWGRYYDKIFLAVPLREIEPQATRIEASTYVFPRFVPTYYFSLPTIGATVTVKTLDRNLRTPHQDEWSASVERALWPETSVKLSWIKREFRDQLQDHDINHTLDGVVLNPGWGEVLQLDNSNSAEYDAWVLELVRRRYRNWELNASYTWSKAWGDAEDFDQLLGDNSALADLERSWLSYDQRHVVRVQAATHTPWGIRLGGSLRWESGLPYSILLANDRRFEVPEAYRNLAVPHTQFGYLYPTGRRNDRRNGGFWTLDLRAAKELRASRGVLVQITGEVFNVLNDDTLRQTDTIGGKFFGVRRFGRQFQLGARVNF